MRAGSSVLVFAWLVIACARPLAQDLRAATPPDRAQNTSPAQPTPPAPEAKRPSAPPQLNVSALMLDVTISRYQDNKLLSSIPYTIAVTPEGPNYRSTLRVGGEVAIPSISRSAAEGADAKTPAPSFSYRSIGTNIDVYAAPAPEHGRYKISLSIEESSVYPPNEAAKNNIVVSAAPAFRSLRSQNTVVLRHGQTIEYIAATDRISGETARISVKLTVVQ